ncbi:DNA polymerase delta subunit 4-like isoform X2 [Xenia sp. Carnegie-2017]|uniref:DNA polymerase delta subunit 4-like isoform X2 n=1 Tax=Xenia sp. Carnegie-2017 TaxID=2897299 RepID=UPI001F04B4E9|nr:DNA polymerase delta subunit 4-like isoform X2 [Xenia sp. Carnegie-2017]
MSEKIHNFYPVVKKSDVLAKKHLPRKANDTLKVKPDIQQEVYPSAKEEYDFSLLKDFDLRCEYGPCIGITRLERWKRAKYHGLNPPIQVKEIIESHENDTSIWHEEDLY